MQLFSPMATNFLYAYMPIYLILVHKGCSFLEGLSRTLKTLLQKGRPFVLRRVVLTGNSAGSIRDRGRMKGKPEVIPADGP